MKYEQRRLLEMAGILRRNTPNHLLFEGDEGGDDPFADDSGDDSGGDDLFGDDSGGDDEGGDDAGDDSGDSAGEEDIGNRIPPQDLEPQDIERFGSPRFKEVDTKLQGFFNQSMKSASVGAQELETYPGVAILPSDEDETPAMDVEAKEKEKQGKDEDKSEKKNESFYRYGNSRDKWLISEATRLLTEAESEGASADEFDLEHFASLVANYMENIHNTMDIEGGIFNGARQIILNNFGPETEEEFCKHLAAINPKFDFKGEHSDIEPQAPAAVGASAAAAG